MRNYDHLIDYYTDHYVYIKWSLFGFGRKRTLIISNTKIATGMSVTEVGRFNVSIGADAKSARLYNSQEREGIALNDLHRIRVYRTGSMAVVN